MDIRLVDAEPISEERAAVDALLGAPRSAWDGGARGDARDGRTSIVGGADSRSQRHLLIPALQALQARMGWISEGGLGYVCERLNVPPADAWGVATFYALLATSPRPKRVVHVCDDIACKCLGADALTAALESTVGHAHGHSHARQDDETRSPGDAADQPVHFGDTDAVWMRSPCLGMCEQGPSALVTIAGPEPSEHLLGRVTAEQVASILREAELKPGFNSGVLGPELKPGFNSPIRQPVSELTLLRRVGSIDPSDIDAYRESGGFEALTKALAMGADAVIAEVTTSKLMGRGGAAFPTGRKWDAVAKQPAEPHYLVCNADESEPGTFKDRVLLEDDPFAIVESMTIAAFACRCSKGFAYIRGEYPLATARLQFAVDEARGAGLLGTNILGSGFSFDIEIRRGAGAYICGEETALFEAIEGKSGFPRNKPPFPVLEGLFGKPTLVNNVETLANVPHIVLAGGAAFAAVGTPASTGTRLFCLSGHVKKPGVYEVPFGTTLRALIDLAGGLRDGHSLRAVLLGGAAGTFVRPDELDLRLTHEDARASNTTLGSGVVLVIDETADLRDLVRRIASFFRDESCGQCVPCRVGVVRQDEALHRISTGRARGGLATELALIDEVGVAMRDASICGLGQTAYAAIESAIKRLRLYDVEGAKA
jgi:NADH-quinone oxidoreductase subunit F